MADTTVPGFIRPDIVDNGSRILTQWGKLQRSLLIIMGTAAPSLGSDAFSTPRPDIIENVRVITRSPNPTLITVLSFYPSDVSVGWDNFLGWPDPEPPFIQQQRHDPLLITTQSYSSYNPAPDIIYKQFRRTPFFAEVVDFIQQSKASLVVGLFIKPLPPGDLTYAYRVKPTFEDRPYDDKTNKGAWHIVMMPNLAPVPLIPKAPSALRFNVSSGTIFMNIRPVDWPQT